MSGARVHIPLTAEQQRVGSLMSAFAYTLFEDGPLVPVKVRGPKREIEGVGLVDTGCGISVVHAPVVESLGCRHVKSQLLIGALKTGAVPTVAVELDVGGVVMREARAVDLEAAQVDMERPELIAIVGRDVLAQCRFVYDGPSGRFQLEVV